MSNTVNALENETEKKLLCPIKHTLDVIGGKWKLPIICMLASGNPTRYSSIKRKLSGITNMMLATSLKELEANGIISRKQYSEIPPRVEYTITETGKSILPALKQLAAWGVKNMESACTNCDSYCNTCNSIN